MPFHQKLVARYKVLRSNSRPLMDSIARTIDRETINAIGQRLGMIQGGTFVFDREDETAVLMDACIFDHYLDGQNLAQRYLRQHPPAAGSDQQLILEALQKARHSLYAIKQVEQGAGVTVEDLLRGGEEFVFDIGFGQTAQPGLVLAARLYSPVAEITMSTGAGLPVGETVARRLAQKLESYIDPETGRVDLSDPDRAARAALLITRTCRRAGASASIRYGEADRENSTTIRSIDAKVGRNNPCPCGSGKKYKKCCGG